VGTPARRVLFESHRDERVCRVARDSSSSDSNPLRMTLGAILRSLAPVSRPELRAVARGSRSRAVGRTLLFLANVPGLVNDRARSSTYPGTRVFSREARAQDRGSRSSERPCFFARFSGRGKSPTIDSPNIAENCLVDILRREYSILPAGLFDLLATFHRPVTVARSAFDEIITRESSAFGAPDLIYLIKGYTLALRIVDELGHSRADVYGDAA